MYAPFGENYGEVGGGFDSLDRSFTDGKRRLDSTLYVR
jgi:hypothetical protein